MTSLCAGLASMCCGQDPEKMPLVKRDWQKGMVYLVQFPRIPVAPTPSPYALKMETWLRVADIPYTNISNELTKRSSKGQIPFIELNGREIADSNIIIEQLKKEFHKDIDSSLSVGDRATMTAYMALLENHLSWCMVTHRARNIHWIASDEQGLGKHLSGIKKTVFQKYLINKMGKGFAAAAHTQGMGRFTTAEVDEFMKKDIDALAYLIGDKEYFFGSKPCTFDCAAFGLLVEIFFAPLSTETIKKYISESSPRIYRFIHRMKEEYWPDWEEATRTLSLNTKWKSEKSSSRM